VEASIVTRCLDCAAVADPATLDVREVAPLRLTAHGRAALRAGQIEESFAALDLPNSVVLNYFRRLVDWALAAQQRHAELSFGLVLIEFEDAAGLIESMGAPRAFLLLDEFARRLHELLRTSDVTTRTSEQKLWVFLPFSSPEGFAARVRRVLQEQAGPVRDKLKVRVRHLWAPAQVARGEQAAELMQRLEGTLKP
jgi:GGDEF domain-containing protein